MGLNTASQGYFLIALGKNYIDECVFLCETIRKQNDNRPISLLINKEDEDYAISKKLFDKFVYFEPKGAIWNNCETGFEKYCLYPRLHFDDYLLYDETIIVDSDVLCQSSTENMWKYLTSTDKPVTMLGRVDDPKWHWGHINEVSQRFGKTVPHVHGGFFYIKKSPLLGKFFSLAKFFFYSYDDYGCKRFFRGGKVDEIIFALTHATMNTPPLEFDEQPIMTFNYSDDISIPSKLQTEGDQNIEMNDYIPFVHMFDKMNGRNFQLLYKKIMNGN